MWLNHTCRCVIGQEDGNRQRDRHSQQQGEDGDEHRGAEHGRDTELHRGSIVGLPAATVGKEAHDATVVNAQSRHGAPQQEACNGSNHDGDQSSRSRRQEFEDSVAWPLNSTSGVSRGKFFGSAGIKPLSSGDGKLRLLWRRGEIIVCHETF